MLPLLAGLPALVQPLLAGGLNLLANAAMVKGKEWIQEKTGVDLEKAQLSDQDLKELRQYEMDHESELLQIKLENNKLATELEKARYADIMNARQLQEKAIDSQDQFVRRFIYYLAIFWSIIASGYIGAITFLDIPKDNLRFADTILGFILGTIVAQILTFFYGSSRSSQNKDEVFKEIMSKVEK